MVASGNHYIAQVKGNQPNLYQAIESLIVENHPIDCQVFEERNRGQDICWEVSVFEAKVGRIQNKWAELKNVIQVQKVVGAQNKQSNSKRFYISDLQINKAAYYQEKIRNHWLIENQLHWVKDVVHKEDNNRIRTKNGPINMSIISGIAINLHRKNERRSITDNQISFCCNIGKAFKVIRT